MYVVYCHTNNINFKSYVGQTQFTMKERWTNGHLVNAAKGEQFVFSNAIRKYGTSDNVWQHTVLEECENLVEAKRLEDFYIEYFQTLTPNGYNMRISGPQGKLTSELKTKIQRSTHDAMWRDDVRMHHLAAQRNPETRYRHAIATSKSWNDPVSRMNHRKGWEESKKVNRHAVEQCDVTSEIVVQTFVSVCEASRETGIHKSSILNHLAGNQRHAGGYLWKRRVPTNDRSI